MMKTATQSTINGTNWDLFGDDDLLQEHGVQVHEYDAETMMAATVRINGTLHLRSYLDISDNRIESRFADWYLTR